MERTERVVNALIGTGIVSVVKTYDASKSAVEKTKAGIGRLEEVGAKYRQQNKKQVQSVPFRDDIYVKTTTMIANLHCKDAQTEQKKRKILAAISNKYSDTRVSDIEFSQYCISILAVPKTR